MARAVDVVKRHKPGVTPRHPLRCFFVPFAKVDVERILVTAAAEGKAPDRWLEDVIRERLYGERGRA